MVLHQYETAQLRPEMAANAAGQRRHDGLAIRCQPALPSIAHYPPRDDQILHLVRLVALELRTLWNCYSEHLGLGCDPRCHLAAAPVFGSLAARLRLGPLLHAARFDRRATLQPLQSGYLIALCRHDDL